MALRSPSVVATGGAIPGGLNNSVLFINPAGTLAQDNTNFTYTIGTTTLAAPTITAATKFLAPDGTAAAPSIAFSSANGVGLLYGGGGNTLRFTTGSVLQGQFDPSGFYFRSSIRLSSDVTGALDWSLATDGANIAALKNANNAEEFRVYAGNGGFMSQVKSVTESLTIAAAATTVGATTIPAAAILLGVSVRVTTVIPTAATFTYATTVGGTTLNTAAVNTAAGSTDPGTAAGASFRAAATTITITPNAQPAAATGVVRLHYYYIQVTPPTS